MTREEIKLLKEEFGNENVTIDLFKQIHNNDFKGNCFVICYKGKVVGNKKEKYDTVRKCIIYLIKREGVK